MKFQPHDYQTKAIKHVIDHPGSGLFLDMGLGKTVITLTAIDLLLAACVIRKVLIVAPLRVAKVTWPAEVGKWDHLRHVELSVIAGNQRIRRNAMQSGAPVHVVNYENLIWLRDMWGKHWPYDMVVFDELSKMKAPGSKRFRAMRSRVHKIDRVVGLTGTPSPNGLLDLWAQMFLLDGGRRLGKSYSDFRFNWFESDFHGYTWTPKPKTDEFIHNAISDICLSMAADDYLTLPDQINNVVPVHMPAPMAIQYSELERSMYLMLGRTEINAVNAAALSSKCMQFVNGGIYLTDDNHHPTGDWQDLNSLKLDALEDIIEEAAGAPVLVAYNFRFDSEKLLQRFPKARELLSSEDVDDWNAGRIPLLLAHPASAGHGLNLQAGGNIIVWYGLTWSLENYQQFNARLHRQGQTKPVFVHHLIAKGTVDELVMERLASKRSVQDVLLEALKRKEAA